MDIFSLGCVFYYILSCGEHPFSTTKDKQTTLTNILSGKYNLNKISSNPEAIELIERMIAYDYILRPTTKEVLGHIMFWDHEKKLRLIMDLSDHLEFIQAHHPTVRKLEEVSKRFKLLETSNNDWSSVLDKVLLHELNKY